MVCYKFLRRKFGVFVGIGSHGMSIVVAPAESVFGRVVFLSNFKLQGRRSLELLPLDYACQRYVFGLFGASMPITIVYCTFFVQML